MLGLVLADVGGRGGPAEAWRQVPGITIVCFEPDVRECERLRLGERSPNIHYEPLALGASCGQAVLHLTRDPACASVYPPDRETLQLIPELRVAEPTGELASVDMETLDGWCARAETRIDALKLDVQGAELAVLRGASRQLEHIVMIEAEVEFNTIYSEQPLFADVDSFLRAHGFLLWRLGHLVHYAPRELESHTRIADLQAFDSRIVEFVAQGGQLFWAHAWYIAGDLLRSPQRERAARAALAARAFGFPDLADALSGP